MKFKIWGRVYATFLLGEVEAGSEAEAKEEANLTVWRAKPRLCHHCSCERNRFLELHLDAIDEVTAEPVREPEGV